ncbi:MAG TPA: hypothetical protein VD963_03640 [Phycisphaerales bacterium]|nr:hypothetical protein [Phycisphaerales bacterium]
MALPIGHLLVQMGALTEQQRVFILQEQEVTGRPFGELAEQMFGLPQKSIEDAWAQQYAATTRWVDPALELVDPAALALVSRRQAWQFRVLPMRYDGGELMVCTTRNHLVRALNFCTRHVPATCYFVLAEPEALGESLMRHFPIDGMNREMVRELGFGPVGGEVAA